MGPEVQKYPFLTVDEWSGACSSFVHACESSIGEYDGWTWITQRKQRVDYIRIVRTVVCTNDRSADGEEQGADAISDGCGGAFEESDEEVAPVNLKRQTGYEDSLTVTYDILLSPSYCVPVLYFSVEKSTGAPVTDLESIYTDLVPSSFRNQVLDAGVIGGISMTDHPITGLPSFFIHPCNTADAMEHVGANRPVLVSEYMLLWMGIISGCVGLHAPASALLKLQTTTENDRNVAIN